MSKPFHKFEQGGHYILLDICAGSVHVVDGLIYKMIGLMGAPPDGEVLPVSSADDTEAKSYSKLGCDSPGLLQYLIETFSDYPERDVKDCFGEIRRMVERGEFSGVDDYRDYADANVDAPLKAMCLHVSHDCNLRCGYCFADGGGFGGERLTMTPDTAKNAVDFLIRSSGERPNLEIDFFGGEPLMAWNTVKAAVEYAKEQGQKHGKDFKFTITTNGLLLDDEKITYINNEMSNVVLSLDGRREVNDRLRKAPSGKGCYDIILPKFKKLIDNRVREGKTDYFIRGTFTSLNLDFAGDVTAIADEGFKNVSIEPVAVSPETPFALRPEHLPRITEEYDRLFDIMREKDGEFNFFHFIIDLKKGPCILKRLRGCGAGNEYIAVAPDGNIFPCHRFVGIDKWKMGNISIGVTDKSIKEYFSHTHIYAKETCPDCWARFYCGGGCNAESYIFEGDARKPAGLSCELMKKRIECAIALVVDREMREQNTLAPDATLSADSTRRSQTAEPL